MTYNKSKDIILFFIQRANYLVFVNFVLFFQDTILGIKYLKWMSF